MKRLLIPGFLCLATLQAPAALIAAYQFDETGGNTAADAIRSAGGVGTLNNFGGTQWQTGKIGNALTFDGSNDYVYAADPVTAGATMLSVSAWIYAANSAPTWGSIAKTWGPGAFHFGFNSTSGAIGNFLNNGGGGSIQAPSTLSLDAWHHVAFTFDGNGATNEHKLYIDGVLVQTITAGVPDALTSDGSIMGIGAKMSDGNSTAPNPSNSPGYWNGKIDDLAFYDNALTQADITTIYNNGLAGISVVPVPEPSCLSLLGLGTLALLRRRRSA